MKLSKTEFFKDEYCATVVRIGQVAPIEGADRIVQTHVNGLSMVIRKEDFKEGDIAIYAANETQLHKDFLRLNNMYSDPELNNDTEQKGYINKQGRVKLIRLKGIPSYGLLIKPESLSVFLGEKVTATDLEAHVGEDFDAINDERFIQVYIPPRVQKEPRVSKPHQRQPKFKMLIDDSFRFHYDTRQFAKEIADFKPNDEVTISVKLHGTSAIFAHILTNEPTRFWVRLWRKYIKHLPPLKQAYNIVYSSRTVIKNEFINPAKPADFYTGDIWGYWAKIIEPYIPKDYCLYCEILGFTPDGSVIQKGYDYGCLPTDGVTSKMMIYRITDHDKELEISAVIRFAEQLREQLGDIIFPYPLLYQGKLKNLYPDLPTNKHWHENVLERLKNDKTFHMNEREPLCRQDVPREGIVIRKTGDVVAEAWKLKCDKFMLRESTIIDSGEIDIEMQQSL